MNSRLDELQSAILRAKLGHLADDNEARRRLAARYTELLAGTGLQLPVERPGARHVYHQYVIRSPRRDALKAHLKEKGVGTLIHYPVPVHLQPAYQGRVPVAPGGLPQPEAAARAVLSLPLYPQLDALEVGQVSEALVAWGGSPAARS